MVCKIPKEEMGDSCGLGLWRESMTGEYDTFHSGQAIVQVVITEDTTNEKAVPSGAEVSEVNMPEETVSAGRQPASANQGTVVQRLAVIFTHQSDDVVRDLRGKRKYM